MIPDCPNNICKAQKSSLLIQKDGFYFRSSDSKKVLRFRCSGCGKRFSSATFSVNYRQNKRRVNPILKKLLSSGVSMRRCALILNITRTTVKRKVIFLGNDAQTSHKLFLNKLTKNKIKHIQFDDLITLEHTKMKPLSVSMAVDGKTRHILGFEVSQIPAFGHLAKKSVEKYGYRKSNHKDSLEKLFENIKTVVDPYAVIRSDQHKLYPQFVKRYFPNSTYYTYQSARGCVAGQGELKRLKFDPLYSINHTFAMLRANINRLVRKTWCTTKNPQMLKHHIQIYIEFHNNILIK